MTDYLALPLRFLNGEIHGASWTTTEPGGFSDAQIEALTAVSKALARITEVYALRRTAVTLLNTYVGRNSGERILRGQIQLGDMEPIVVSDDFRRQCDGDFSSLGRHRLKGFDQPQEAFTPSD